MERQLEILSAGKTVALNGFAKKVALNTLLGLLGSLHDVNLEEEIRITVKPGT
jgi:hypothetical protein